MIDNALYDIREERLITVLNSIKSIWINKETRIIGKNAFFGLDIKYIYLPETVMQIDETAFYHCFQLKSILVPQKQYLRIFNIMPSYVKEYVTDKNWFTID